MEEREHSAFELKDFFHEDPFRMIYSKRREDTYFFNTYIDYSQDLESLKIAWQRIKQGCKDVGEINAQIQKIPSNEIRNDEGASLLFREHGMMTILQYDVVSFINIARTIMDKLAKLVVRILGLLQGWGPRISFTDHQKEFPRDHPEIHPVYISLLHNKTYWYNQELLLLRDKIFIHGNTFITSWGVTQRKK